MGALGVGDCMVAIRFQRSDDGTFVLTYGAVWSKHNTEQFEILDMDRPLIKELSGRQSRFWLNGREIYARLTFRRRCSE